MSTMSSSSSSSSRRTTAQADAKISNDLHVLKEKMDLLESMIHNNDTTTTQQLSVTTNEAVRSVVGHLDACGPRMIELVTACTTTSQSVLSESVFGNVLGCNDRLQKLLLDVDALLVQEETEAAAALSTNVATASDVAGESATAAPDLTEQFGDLLLGSNEDSFMEDAVEPSSSASTTPPTTNTTTATMKAGAKTTGETDEDFENFLSGATTVAPPPVPAVAAAVAAAAPDVVAAAAADAPDVAVAPAAAADPFDDFFAERTETNF